MSATEHIPRYDLAATLVGNARVVSLVGAGGKKTTLYALARALPRRVALSSSSHMAAYDASVVDEVVTIPAGTASLPASRGRIVAFGGAAETPQRIHGLSLAQIERLVAEHCFDHVLIKADGARGRWIKAPAAYEPVVPTCTDRVLYLLSAQVIGVPLDERIAHRVAQLAALCDATPGAPLTVDHLATLLASEAGALQGIGRSTLLPVINMVDNEMLAVAAREVAYRALARTTRFDRVVLANMKDARVVEVITRDDPSGKPP